MKNTKKNVPVIGHLEKAMAIALHVWSQNSIVYGAEGKFPRYGYTFSFLQETYHMEGRLNFLKKTQILGSKVS